MVFHPGYDEDSDDALRRGIFTGIRDTEASYLPYALRRTLVDSNHWGAVRVLPREAYGAELLVTGRILKSDGTTLEFRLTARDSRGKTWVDRVFSGAASEAAYAASERRTRRPFQGIYNEVANALLEARSELSRRELANIREVALLRYAESLAPEAFGGYLERDASGELQIRRLPSREDPMMARVQRIRAQEHLFIDTTDEQYDALYTAMMPIYDLWRSSQREQVLYQDTYQQRLAERDKPRRGSYEALKRNYYNFRWAKLQHQELKLLAEGFSNEVAPTNMDIEGKVFKLSGSLDERYREWRGILRRIYDLEGGVGP